MDYKNAVEYIESIPRFTKKTTLEHTRAFLRLLGSPEKSFRVIHVAGTNGKGSVCSYLDSMIRENGYSCGLFTSPHLVRINERFRINGRDCPDEDFLEAFETVRRIFPEAERNGLEHPTYFETLFLMGMVLFRKEGVSFAVLETGMGGRLDATNAVGNPLITVITSIGMDHMKYLGDTISAIAGEKAGIIKPGVPVVYDAGRAEASGVIREQARKLGAPAIPVKEEQIHSPAGPEGEKPELFPDTGRTFCYVRENGERYPLRIRNIARCQMMNAALAFESLKQLEDLCRGEDAAFPENTPDPVGRPDSAPCFRDDRSRKGLKKAYWPCRMERVRPGVLVDGSHNEDGIRELIRTVREVRNRREVILLFGALSDHEHLKMAEMITEGLSPDYVIVTEPESSRAADARNVAEEFRKAGCRRVEAVRKTEQACGRAEDILGQDPARRMIVCAGSLYLAGAVRERFLKGAGIRCERGAYAEF